MATTQILNTPLLSLGWSAFEQDAEPEANKGLVFLVR
jgi:hypothetical protein